VDQPDGRRRSAARFVRTCGPRLRLLGNARTVVTVVVLVVVLEALYVVVSPHTPDLNAQLARAGAASRGVGLWWEGWYGGVNTATYSLLSASLMNVLGVLLVGILTTVAISLAACANLYSGRITFAAGMSVALVGFALNQRGRTRLATASALITGLLSPLAAMYQAIGLVALAIDHRGRGRGYLLGAGAACAPVVVVSLLFSEPSYQPFELADLAFLVLVCAGVLLAAVPRVVRVLALLSSAVALGAWLVPSPIGSNAARLPMLLAAPLVVATARGGRWRTRVLALALAAWPVITLTTDMAIAAQPSAQQAFYAPLLQHLPAAGRAVQRLELLDSESHAGALYVSQRMPLARGWERQIDRANNSQFYEGTLTPLRYRDWLVTHAVGWIAMPRGSLDYGSSREQQLLQQPPDYLHLAWASGDWLLYRVLTPAPVATGVLRVTAMTDTGIDLVANKAGSGLVRVPFSWLLTVVSTDVPGRVGCIRPAEQGSILLSLPAPGTYRLHADLTPLPSQCLDGSTSGGAEATPSTTPTAGRD
jgi:hypothetical protein